MDTVITYMEEFDEIAYQELSVPLRNVDHLCKALFCTKETLDQWIADNPSFSESVNRGLIVGEQKYRDLASLLSMLPQSEINTKLLTIMGSNVYGITDDKTVHISSDSQEKAAPEELMKRRGIPIPTIDIDDSDSENQDLDGLQDESSDD